VTLHWKDNSSNETAFYIERAPKGSAFVRIASAGANTVTFIDTVGRGFYAYRVQVFNTATGKLSAYSNQVQVKVR
jgi:titin